MNYSAINIQGNILSSEVLEKIRTEDMRYQTAKDFGLDPNTSVRDEISLAWSLALSHWKAFKQKRESLSASDTGTTETRNYWMKPLMGILGYDLTAATAEIINGKSYAISFRAANLDNFPVHIVGINQSLDARAESGGPRLSPHALAQEYLNNQEHMYALVSNGKFLRLLRDATRLSRLSYMEFNMEQMMEESLYAEFALLYRVLHASRMPKKGDAGAESILEFYHQEALASGSRIRERLSAAVETSIKELANGFLRHSQNEALHQAVNSHQLDAKTYYLYNLRIIYRVLFLMVIEERKLIFPAERNEALEQERAIYYNYYSVQRLSRLVEKAVYVDPKKTDLWASLVTCFTLFENSKYGAQLGIAPLGSGLFAPDALGIMGEQVLDNDTVLKVMRHLVTFESETGQRKRVNYADLDVEEFGSVYEGLLEYEPQLLHLGTEPHFIFKEGNERSKSGSHYTPEELVKPLIQHSLDYLIQDKLKEKDPEAGLLSLKVCDVACGSGHILLSAARRIGFELAKLRSKEDQPSPTVLRQAIRDVIHHCIYGVDKNPLAVELCKVAMWLEAHNPGQPLNFLDHHIKCGDAIVGLAHQEELEKGIADEAFKTLSGDDKDIAKSWRDKNVKERKERAAKATQIKADFEKGTTNSVEEAIAEYRSFNRLPEATPEEIERKAKAYKKFLDGKGFTFLKAMADTQVAQFFFQKTTETKDCLMTDADFRLILSGYKGWQDRRIAKAAAVAEEKRFFHWFLEFPEVFSEGGFDCILGNPPYLGGTLISGAFQKTYYEYLVANYSNASNRCDLLGYFLRRIYDVVKSNGYLSLIATNSISEGDTRVGGLEMILAKGGVINFAAKSIPWPGKAAVIISLVSIFKGKYTNKKYLHGKLVTDINSFLETGTSKGAPKPLYKNDNKGFNGSYVFGDGFLLEPQVAEKLIKERKENSEILFPYLNGDDLNSSFLLKASRWVINFSDMTIEKAKCYDECFKIVERNVKEFRLSKSKDVASAPWWQFWRLRKALYSKIKNFDRVLIHTRVTKTHGFSFVPSNMVYSDATVVIADDSYKTFTFLQSSVHESWAWQYSSRLKSDRRYSVEDCFQTFAFPKEISSLDVLQLDEIGSAYEKLRSELMIAIQLGLTKTYNAFHAPGMKPDINTTALQVLDKKAIEKNYGKEVWNLWNHLQKTAGACSIEEAIAGIIKLRELHVQMDNAVLEAYVWSDIQLRHDFYEVDYLPENDRIRFTIHPDARKEVLKRLLELNHKIHAEEVAAGLWDKKGKKKKYSDSEDELSTVEEPDEALGGLFNQE